ncbi:hypothetical protein EVAR_102992_1 [Eumeta japonica]|uniref:Uncharacterized protein n=1 Tax=Eumeta variegata TaxID=151549 RepID=A0A4C1UQ16_EUMVA|nr:hypothetical protein EVAR_102992_1 [Eumeta japonica]
MGTQRRDKGKRSYNLIHVQHPHVLASFPPNSGTWFGTYRAAWPRAGRCAPAAVTGRRHQRLDVLFYARSERFNSIQIRPPPPSARSLANYPLRSCEPNEIKFIIVAIHRRRLRRAEARVRAGAPAAAQRALEGELRDCVHGEVRHELGTVRYASNSRPFRIPPTGNRQAECEWTRVPLRLRLYPNCLFA